MKLQPMSAQTPSLFHRLVGLISRVTSRAEPLPVEDTQVYLDRITEAFNVKVDALVAGMDNGTISIGQFVGALPSLIKQQHLTAAVIGEGGSHLATPDTLALAQRNVDTQLAYFDRWKADLLQQAANGQLPSSAYIANRAKLYGKAAGATASEATANARGLPPLPFYPADGQTRCRVNCACQWDVKPLDVVNGNYDCYWSLGMAEHCPTCIARQRAANPLRIRRGIILNPEKYQASNLYA